MRSQRWGIRRLAVLRIGLSVLAVTNAGAGGWALVFPRSFYADFPGLGMHWVAAAPPYNEHLVTDFGAALLAIAVALCLAAITAEPRVVQVVLLAALVQAVPHLTFHLSHLDTLRGTGGPMLLPAAALALPVVLTLGLLWLTRHSNRSVMASETVGEPKTAGSSQ